MTGGAVVIALVGGECSGKTSLAHTLLQQLDRLGVTATVVDESLRDWVGRHGCSPRAHEQAAQAQAQVTAIETARQQPGIRLVLADTTAVVTAAYSELYFDDTSLWNTALDRQRTYQQTWLMGTDLPWKADGVQRDGPVWRARADALLRQRMQSAALPFQTFHGSLALRLDQALRSLKPWLGDVALPDERALTQGRVPWRCDNCSDPDCEHRLFSRLLPRP